MDTKASNNQFPDIENSSDELTEQDLHCAARLLQSIFFGQGNHFMGCRFCKYSCIETGNLNHFRVLLDKLDNITGVDLSPVEKLHEDPLFKINVARFLKASCPAAKEKILDELQF